MLFGSVWRQPSQIPLVPLAHVASALLASEPSTFSLALDGDELQQQPSSSNPLGGDMLQARA